MNATTGGGGQRTIAASVVVEPDKVKGSRFVCHLVPCSTPDAARAVVEALRVEHPDATHHCWAWRLGDGREQASDDGEPRDTAGAPILRHLAGAALVDLVAVVVRWFGGTKLGRGGLVRAYGDATAAAIAGAIVVEHVPTVRLVVRHAYDLTGAVDGVLHAHDAEVVADAYAADVSRTVEVVADRADDLRSALVDATADRAEILPTDPV